MEKTGIFCYGRGKKSGENFKAGICGQEKIREEKIKNLTEECRQHSNRLKDARKRLELFIRKAEQVQGELKAGFQQESALLEKWENQEERPEKILAAAEIELEHLKTERSILETQWQEASGREFQMSGQNKY